MIAQIESAAAVECVEEIAQVEGVAALYVGPWDLSVSLGVPVPPDLDGEVLASAIARVRKAADAAGLPAGVHTIRAASAGSSRRRGMASRERRRRRDAPARRRRRRRRDRPPS